MSGASAPCFEVRRRDRGLCTLGIGGIPNSHPSGWRHGPASALMMERRMPGVRAKSLSAQTNAMMSANTSQSTLRFKISGLSCHSPVLPWAQAVWIDTFTRLLISEQKDISLVKAIGLL